MQLIEYSIGGDNITRYLFRACYIKSSSKLSFCSWHFDRSESAEPEPPQASASGSAEAEKGGGGGGGGCGAAESDSESESESSAQRDAGASLYASGRYSPAPLAPAQLEPGTLLTEPADDAQRLAYLRAAVQAQRCSAPASGAALEREARRAMGASPDEAQFSVEHALPDQPCLWADKYRPRKPRYFNRYPTVPPPSLRPPPPYYCRYLSTLRRFNEKRFKLDYVKLSIKVM